MPNNVVVPELNDFINFKQEPQVSNIEHNENENFQGELNNILAQEETQTLLNKNFLEIASAREFDVFDNNKLKEAFTIDNELKKEISEVTNSKDGLKLIENLTKLILFIDKNRNYKNEIGGAKEDQNEINFSEISKQTPAVLYNRCEFDGNDKVIGAIFGAGTTWDIISYIAYCIKNELQLDGIQYSDYFKGIIIKENKNKTDLGQELANALSSAFIIAVPSDKLEYVDTKFAEDNIILTDSAFFKSELFIYIERIEMELERLKKMETKLKSIEITKRIKELEEKEFQYNEKLIKFVKPGQTHEEAKNTLEENIYEIGEIYKVIINKMSKIDVNKNNSDPDQDLLVLETIGEIRHAKKTVDYCFNDKTKFFNASKHPNKPIKCGIKNFLKQGNSYKSIETRLQKNVDNYEENKSQTSKKESEPNMNKQL